MTEFMNRIDAVFLGRITYEMSLGMNGTGGGPVMEEFMFSTILETVKKGTLIRANPEKEETKSNKKKEKTFGFLVLPVLPVHF
jgi:hypothetical protein